MKRSTKNAWRRLGGALVAVTLGFACAPRQPFMPTERLTAYSPQGYAAAEYDLHTRRGHLGQVRVWSHGAERVTFEGRRRALLHIGLEIQNESNTPLVLDEGQLHLDSATVNGTVFENIPVARIRGNTVVPPGGETTVDVYFALSPGIYPTDVRAFRFRWALRDDGAVYTQRTPFIEEPWGPPRGPYYHTPFYDPFYYGYFGPRGMIMHPYPYYHYRHY